MYFILSKVLLMFILPITWIVILFAAGLIIRRPKPKKTFLLSAFIVLLIFSNPYLLSLFISCWDVVPPKADSSVKYSAGILLGGFAGEDADGNGRFNGASDRFIQAVILKNTDKVNVLLMSSGNASLNPSAFREADWVKGQLKLLKIPDSCVLIENQSRNTIENAFYSKQLLKKKGLQPPYLLITSAFHMRRSLYTFKKSGLDVVPYPCNFIGRQNFSLDAMIPSADALVAWNLYTKEVFGLMAVSLKKIPAG